MEKAMVLSIQYQPSDSIERQGKRSDIERYIKDGYYVKENRNGYWVLVKSAKLYVALSNSYGSKVFNMKDDVCIYYGKTRISNSLADRFEMDIKNEKIVIYMDSKGNYSIR